MLTKRERVLRAVGTEGSEKRELVDELSVSRSTIDRSVRELESAGLIRRIGGGYQRTLLGELLLEEYGEFASRVESILRSGNALASLSPELDLGAAMLEDAAVVTAQRHAPHQPVSELCDLLERSRWVQTVLPAVFPQVIERCAESTETRELRADVVVTEPVVEGLVAGHADALQRLLSAERVSLHRTEYEPDYGLVLAEDDDRTVAALVILDEGGARALITNETSRAVEWVRDRIDASLEASEPLTSPSPRDRE